MKIKTGDKVRVISGKDRGKEGTIKKILKSKDRVIVESINMIKKHQKATNTNPQGGIVDTEAPIHISNIQLIDPSNNEPTRVGVRVEDGKRVRYSKKTGEVLDK